MPRIVEIDPFENDPENCIESLRIDPAEEDESEIIDAEEEAEEDEDDEEEEDEPVLLGFLEKQKNPELLLRHFFPSKAGGVPAWLDPEDLPSEQSRKCGFCGEPLQFLLQVYAPLFEKETTFHRTLYVFMCPSMSCLLRDQHEQWKRKVDNPSRSVKIFRCQLPRVNSFYSSEPPKKDGSDKPSGPGAPLCCWCGTWKGNKLCSSCKKSRYCSEKHQKLHWRSGHKSECASTSNFVNDKLAKNKKFACKTLWQEYEIIIDDETMPDEDGQSCLPLAVKGDESGEAMQSVFDKFEMDSDKKSWASFQQRISNDPEQILRYCREARAKPLWPLSSGIPSKADLPKCPYCSGPLCYEFQILPQLLYFFNVKNDVDSLDWATIVVYTCMASCDVRVAYKEEFAWVQLSTPTSIV